ncbi:MAG TPA: sigma-70 family RNA polymerase sigma factor, partial [Solirubrobacterales bacterium]|nr:sigma-70 family RNA polymerase sigma factor [Solirubrobacterales bacterium]
RSRSASRIATTTRDPGGARRRGGQPTPMSLEPEDLTRLYERTARPLLVFFQRRVDDPEVAVDLMSDCFTIALERRHQFRGEDDDALSGWLWSIAQSVLREYERRDESARRWARRLGRERRALTDKEIERIEELAASESIRDAVTRSLDRLPEDQREAVRLRIVEGLPYSEVAARLGLTASGTRTRVTRAMRTLRGMLEGQGEELP